MPAGVVAHRGGRSESTSISDRCEPAVDTYRVCRGSLRLTVRVWIHSQVGRCRVVFRASRTIRAGNDAFEDIMGSA